MVLGQEEGQAKREEGGKEPVGSPWAVDGLDPPSAHAHQPSRHYFCWAWALGGVNGRSIIRRLGQAPNKKTREFSLVSRAEKAVASS